MLPSALVSICIPTFNRYEELKSCLSLVLVQDYPDLEVVISDNTDFLDTPQWLHQLANQDDRIKYLKQPSNIGMIENIYFLRSKACGEYMCIVQDDDLIAPNFVSSIMSEIHRHPGVVLCGPSCDRYYNGKFWYQYSDFTNIGESQLTRLLHLSRYAFESPWEFETLIYGIYKKDAFPEAFLFGRWRATIRFFFGISISGYIHTCKATKVQKNTATSDIAKYQNADYVIRHSWMKLLSRRQEERITVLIELVLQISRSSRISLNHKYTIILNCFKCYLVNKPEKQSPPFPT